MNYQFNFKGNTYLFNKDESDKDKYIVFTCAKNEDDYIIEWVEHYLKLGFDKIIIADNNDDNTILSNKLYKYIFNGEVEIFDCSGMNGFQLYIYNMYLVENNFKWCAFFDCDEFLELNIHSSIKDFLDDIQEDCVLINWMVFGSNGIINRENTNVQDRFKVPVYPISLFKENMYVKPIVRSDRNFNRMIDTHCPLGQNVKYNIGGEIIVNNPSHVYYPPRYKYAYIKHYYCKSFNEWISNKIKRGWPDEIQLSLNVSNYFLLENRESFPIEKFVNGLFVDNEYYDNIDKNYKDILDEFDVIKLVDSTQNTYALVLMAFALLKRTDNHIFIIMSNEIDDNLYNTMLEYSFYTTNKIFRVSNENEVWKIMNKYAKKNKSFYYYFDCL